MSRIQPVSLALGLALGVCAILSMSQASVIHTPLRVEYMPHPRDMVQIKEGTPFTVPGGKVFVLTGLGSAQAGTTGGAWVMVNGQVELSITSFAQGNTVGNVPSVGEIPTGLTSAPGSTLTVGSSVAGTGRAWGYLAQQ